MNVNFEQLTVTLDAPWTPSVVQLIGREILELLPEEWTDLPECIDRYLTPDLVNYYGLVERSELTAVGSLMSINDSLGAIDYLAVQPEKQGKGYGGQLLEELEIVARAAGITTLRTEPMREAEAFFTRKGYRYSPDRTGYTWQKRLAVY